MKNYQMFFLGVVVVMFSSCARVFQTTDASSIATQHQKMAIITPEVQISPQAFTRKDARQQMEKSEAVSLQYEMYDWIIRRQTQGRLAKVSILNIEETNRILNEAGYYDGTYLSERELCELLGVDAILASSYTLNNPFTSTGMLVNTVLIDGELPTKETSIILSLYDYGSEKEIWQYRNQMLEVAYNNRTTFVQSFMRHASRRMPYRK